MSFFKLKKWWILLAIIVIYPVAVHLVFDLLIKKQANYTIDIGELLTFFGTILLGIITVYQTRKANGISTKLMEKELRSSTPYVDLQGISETKMKKYDKDRSIICSVDGCYTHIDDALNAVYINGETLFFLLKNVRDIDILSLYVVEVEIGINIDNKIIENRVYPLSNTIRKNSLERNESVILITVIPDDSFGKVAKYAQNLNEDKQAYLHLNYLFELMNNDGRKYFERIALDITNSRSTGMRSKSFINKKNYEIEEDNKTTR